MRRMFAAHCSAAEKLKMAERAACAGKYREEDYRYAAAKVSAMSCELIPQARIRELARARDAAEVMSRIAEYGFDTAADGTEAALTAYLAERYETLLSFCPSTPLAQLCRMRYDCNNLKSAIKCRAGGRDAAPLMIRCGLIPADDVIAAAEKNDFSVFAKTLPNMSRAADMASEALGKSGNSRTVDSLLDRACFADMRTAARATGIREVVALLERKTDATNLLTAARVLRLRDAGMRRAVFDDSVISGGKIDMKKLRDADSLQALAALADDAGYPDAARALRSAGSDAASLERMSHAFDDDFRAAVDAATRMQLLGAYPVIGYIAALEYEVKNLRIILSGIEAGDDRSLIEERLRIA